MKKTKLLLIIFSVVVFLLVCTLVVNATDVVKSGSAGSATWTLYDDGRMVIKGSGEVEKPVYREQKKIKSLSATLKAKVKTLILDDRITSIGHDWDSEDPFGTYVFANFINLESVELPSNLTYITHSAFENCKSLTSIDIPGSVKTVGSSAFYDCEKLEELTFHEGIEMLDDNAFEGCTALMSIHIPKSLTKMYGSSVKVFAYCENLKEITVAGDNPKYTSTDLGKNECNAIMDKTRKILYLGCKNTEIPQGITDIENKAFAGSGIESIQLPDSITVIGDEAFRYCGKLKSFNIPDKVLQLGSGIFAESGIEKIEIPKNVRDIKPSAFMWCEKIESITVDANNLIYTSKDSNGDECNAIFEKNKLIIGCNKTRIPDTITSIGSGAFNYRNISDLSIPNSVEIIESSAFRGCKGLETLVIPQSVTSIKNYAFGECEIKNVKILQGLTQVSEELFYDSQVENVELPNTIKSIGESAFQYCEKLKKVLIPNKAIYVNSNAFSGCKSLSDESKKSIYNANKKYIQKTSTKGIKLKTSKRKITITWTGVSDKNVKPIAYVVYRGTKAKKLKKIATVKTKKYTEKKKLRKGRKYYYKVVGKVKNLDGKYCYTKPTVVKNIRCK